MGKRSVTIATTKAKDHHAMAFGSKFVPTLLPPPGLKKKKKKNSREPNEKQSKRKTKPSVSFNDMSLVFSPETPHVHVSHTSLNEIDTSCNT